LGEERAHKILPKLVSQFKNKNIFIPLPVKEIDIFWVGIRNSIDYDIFQDVCINDSYNLQSILKP